MHKTIITWNVSTQQIPKHLKYLKVTKQSKIKEKSAQKSKRLKITENYQKA